MMRYWFNTWLYRERVYGGSIKCRTERVSTPRSDSGQPRGTEGRRCSYREGRRLVAIAFHYRRPDGYVRPDPKWLLYDDGQVLDDPHSDGEHCEHCDRYKPLCFPFTVFPDRTP
jgi:hypothetical protein